MGYVILFFIIVAVLIAWLACSFYDNIKGVLLFEDMKFKKFNQQIRILSEVGFVFSIFILIIKIIIFVLTHLLNKSNEIALVMSLKVVKSNSFMNFIIFFGLYAYVITHKGSILF